MPNYCAVYGCLSSSQYDKNRRFFHFPLDESRCKKWVQACDRHDLAAKTTAVLHKNHLVCDLHFETDDFLVKKLKQYVIPTLNLPLKPSKSTQTEESIEKGHFLFIKVEEGTGTEQNIIEKSQMTIPQSTLVKSSMTQTTQDLSANTPRKRKLLSELKSEGKVRRITENEHKCISTIKSDSNLSPQLCKLIDLQYQLKRNSQGNRHNMEYKLFVLNIYFASPLAYRVLSNTLSLPSERTLRRMNINNGTKLCSSVIKCLEAKVKHMKEADKYCIICADEISLKRNLYYNIHEDRIVGFHEIDNVQTVAPAAHGFVIMARGIFSNWKQQLGYSLLAQSKNYQELNAWLDDIISKVISVGFKVVAFVSDQRSIFLNLAADRNVSIDNPYFFVNGSKIYYIFDVPHLIKSVRNNLMKYNFEYLDVNGTKMTAKWEDIEKFYREDSNRAFRLAPKLTESHINPNNLEKMKVYYATQVFSNTVAAAMSYYVECGLLDRDSLGTIQLIGLMDKTFDLLNSSVINDCNKYKVGFSSETYQIELLNQFELFLFNVTVLNKAKKNVTNSLKFLKGLKISVKSIKCLAQDLKSARFPFVFTRRLNQGPLENFFGSVPKQGGNCRKPTPIQFTRAFRKLFMVNILKHSASANCADDLDHLLINTGDVNNIVTSLENDNDTATCPIAVTVGTVDYRFDLPAKNAFVYVCGYLLKKCFDMHKCEKINALVSQSDDQAPKNGFVSIKSFNHDKMLVINPPESFITCVKMMDDRFKLLFQPNLLLLNSVGNKFFKLLNDISFNDCCNCFPNTYLKKLFVRFRIFNIIKFNNRLFKDKSYNRNDFGVNNI